MKAQVAGRRRGVLTTCVNGCNGTSLKSVLAGRVVVSAMNCSLHELKLKLTAQTVVQLLLISDAFIYQSPTAFVFTLSRTNAAMTGDRDVVDSIGSVI